MVAIVTVTMLRLAPETSINPYNHTTTRRIGPRVTRACLIERNPMAREMNTNNEPKTREDCISSCISVDATYRVTGRPVVMTQVRGFSSVGAVPEDSCVPVERLVKTSRSLHSFSMAGARLGKSSGPVMPNRINMWLYSAGSPLMSSQGVVGASSTFGMM